MTWTTLALAMAAGLQLGGCGGDEGNAGPGPTDTKDCSVSVTLSGAVSETIAYDVDDGCSGSSTDVFTALSWGGIGDTPNFGLVINGTTAQLGKNLLARAVFVSADATATWETPDTCRVDITASTALETTDLGVSYAIEGEGTCADPAVDATGAQEDVEVGAFSFRAETRPY